MKTPKAHAMNEEVMKTESNTLEIPDCSQTAQLVDAVDAKGERFWFEAWARGQGFNVRPNSRALPHGGEYITADTSNAWEGWQGRAALAHPRPTGEVAVMPAEPGGGVLPLPSDGELIDMANSVFHDTPRKSEGRKDNDMFYLRFARALYARVTSRPAAPTVEQAGEVVDEDMRVAVALSFADDPRPYHSLAAPSDTNSELYRALRVLAREYRASLAHPRATGDECRLAPVEQERFETWMKRSGANIRKRPDGVYADHTVMCCWNAWWMSASFKTDTSLTTVPYALADVVRAVRRFDECAEDGEDVDLGRDWFDALTTIGLLWRVQRSPARWQMTDAGHSLLALPAPTAEQAGEVVAWMRRTIDFSSADGRREGERVISEDKVYPDDIPLYAQPRPVGVPDGPLTGKYANVLVPFVTLMERELHANAGKGDRPGWLGMTRTVAVLEIHHHVAKLQKAVLNGDIAGVREYAADVANMSMMAVDVCGALIDAAHAPEVKS